MEVLYLKKTCLFLGSTTSSSTLHNEAEVGDDDVFTVSASPFRSFSFVLWFDTVRFERLKGFLLLLFYYLGLASGFNYVCTVGVFYLMEA